MTEQRILTVREAAVILGIGFQTLYSRIWAQKIPAEKRGGKWFIPQKTVEELARRRQAGRNG
jgi:excisionase family DNA binding protein